MKIKNVFLFFMMFLAMICISSKMDVYAATANIAFSVDNDEVEVGDNVIVTISVDADTDISWVEAAVTYNSDVLKFISGTNVMGDSGILRLSDENAAGGTTRSYSISFEAIAEGYCKFKVTGEPHFFDINSEEIEYGGFEEAKLNVIGGEKANMDATLKSLKVAPGELDEAFSSSVKLYKMTVDYSCTSIKVDAITSDKDAEVSIEGNEELKEGLNDVYVKVTASAGNKNTYTISVYRKFADEDEYSEENQNKKLYDDVNGEVKIVEADGKVFLTNAFKYEVVSLENDDDIPVGYKKTKVSIYGTNVEAYLPEDNAESDFILIYAANSTTGDTNFYQYDKIENTIQRYSGGTASTVVKAKDSDMNAKLYQEKLNLLSMIVAGLVIIVVITISLLIRYRIMVSSYTAPKKNKDIFD